MILKISCFTILLIFQCVALSHNSKVAKLAVVYSEAKNDQFESNLQCSVDFINSLALLPLDWQISIEITNLDVANDATGLKLQELGQNLYENGGFWGLIGPEVAENVRDLHPYAAGINIPHISPIASDGFLKNDGTYPNLIRMTKGYSYKIAALLDFVEGQGWDSIGVMTSDDIYYQYLTFDLMDAAEQRGITLLVQQTFHEVSAGLVEATEELLSFKRAGQRVIILLCPTHQIEPVMRTAEICGLTNEKWAFLLWQDVEIISKADTLTPLNSFTGLVGTRLAVVPGFRYIHVEDYCDGMSSDSFTLQYMNSLLAMDDALKLFLHDHPTTNPPTGGQEWEHGSELVNNILDPGILPPGVTSDLLSFNSSEQMTTTMPHYDIMNLHSDGWKTVATWSASDSLQTTGEEVVFMGGAGNVSSYVRELRYQELRVVTVEAPPFMFVDYTTDHQGENTTQFSGFLIDLLQEMATEVGFTFKVELLRSGLFGGRDPISGQWDGVVGEVVAGRADLALAPLTITQQRMESVDFTAQYYKTDLKYAVNENSAHGVLSGYNRYAFVLPFTTLLWEVIFGTVFVLAVFFTIVSRLSPFGAGQYFQSSEAEEAHDRLERRRSSTMSFVGSTTNVFGKRRQSIGGAMMSRRQAGMAATTNSGHDNNDLIGDITEEEEAIDEDEHHRSEVERQMSFSNALYFAFAGLLWQSPESVPHAPSARVAAAVWYMAGVILVASYTANMVTFVTETSEKTRLLTVRELLLQDNVVPATVKSTSVNSLLRAATLPLAEKLYEAMLNHPDESFLESEQLAVGEMMKGNIAFIWDGAMLDYAAKLSNCELSTVPLGFGEAYYAYALPYGSAFTAELSTQINRLGDNGFIKSLEEKYFPIAEACIGKLDEEGTDNQSYVPLTYSSLSGVFDMVLIMAAVSLIVLLLEWLFVSIGDVDRTNPYKPSSLRSAFNTRWQRLVADATEHWIPFKNLRRKLRKRFGKVSPANKVEPKAGKTIEMDQWQRYTSSQSAEELQKGQSISDPNMQQNSLLALANLQ